MPRIFETAHSGPPPGHEGAVRLKDAVDQLERSLILAALQKSNWASAKAARLLGISAKLLTSKMSSLGIEKPR